jgi:hypothetical protein
MNDRSHKWLVQKLENYCAFQRWFLKCKPVNQSSPLSILSNPGASSMNSLHDIYLNRRPDEFRASIAVQPAVSSKSPYGNYVRLDRYSREETLQGLRIGTCSRSSRSPMIQSLAVVTKVLWILGEFTPSASAYYCGVRFSCDYMGKYSRT